jgi:hypothetical protein
MTRYFKLSNERTDLVLEVFLAICLGAVIFCANAVAVIVAIRFLGALTMDRFCIVSTPTILVCSVILMRAFEMRVAGVTTLSILATLIVICNFMFTGYIFSTI